MDKVYRVLVVDDEQHVIDAIVSLLHKLPDITLSTASRGAQALSLLSRQSFDLLITDVRMPDMTGLELLRSVGERHPLLKAIVLTGYPDFSYAYEAIRMHVAAYILKSEEETALLAAVCKALLLPYPVNIRQDAESSVQETVRNARRYVADHMSSGISCAQIASELGYSEDHLARIYLRATGEKLSAYLRRMKLERIDMLMRNSALTLEQIARMTGFSSRSYFNRFMKNETGSSPGQYRQSQRHED